MALLAIVPCDRNAAAFPETQSHLVLTSASALELPIKPDDLHSWLLIWALARSKQPVERLPSKMISRLLLCFGILELGLPVTRMPDRQG